MKPRYESHIKPKNIRCYYSSHYDGNVGERGHLEHIFCSLAVESTKIKGETF